MTKIQRSKERIKQTGEVFTPLPLVDEILTKMPDEVWNPDKKFIDPACGDGNFLVRVIAWKIWKGSPVERALSTTYGVELMEDNANHTRQRVLLYAFLFSSYKTSINTFWSNEYEHMLFNELSNNNEYMRFCQQHQHIVNKNIVCANSLEYDFSFE